MNSGPLIIYSTDNYVVLLQEDYVVERCVIITGATYYEVVNRKFGTVEANKISQLPVAIEVARKLDESLKKFGPLRPVPAKTGGGGDEPKLH